MCPCSAAGGWSVEVWRWVEAGEHQLGGWRYGGGGWRQHQTRPPGTVLAVAGGWVVVLAMGPGHPLVWRTLTPPLVAAGHCSLSRHLVTSVLTAPLRPRSHQALLRLRLAEVCCWWPRGRGSSRWMAGCGTSSQPPSRGHCTLYTVQYTVQLARPLYTRGRVSDSSWWLVVAGVPRQCHYYTQPPPCSHLLHTSAMSHPALAITLSGCLADSYTN